MNRSEQINELATALAKAQGSFPVIPRNKSVLVRMKSGGTYAFTYAPLETIIAAIKIPLSSNGLSVTQTITDAGFVATTLWHASGQFIELGPIKISPSAQDPQSIGAAITYSRRYSLTMALNLSADEDNENLLKEGNKESEVDAPDMALLALAEAAAAGGIETYGKFFAENTKEQRKSLASAHPALKKRAEEVSRKAALKVDADGVVAE